MDWSCGSPMEITASLHLGLFDRNAGFRRRVGCNISLEKRVDSMRLLSHHATLETQSLTYPAYEHSASCPGRGGFVWGRGPEDRVGVRCVIRLRFDPGSEAGMGTLERISAVRLVAAERYPRTDRLLNAPEGALTAPPP